MADKSIFELTLQTTFASNDRLVVGNYANSDAEAITGQTLVNLLATSLDGHGGIQSITKTSSSGTDPVIDTYTILMADTSTTTFTVTNGLKGDQGLQTFVYFRWSHVEPSSWSDTTSQPDEWMGVYAGTATTPPTTVSAYTWVKVRGETGETGEAASISSQSVTYMESTSGTIVPSGSWSENVPSVTPGNFLWTRTQLTFNDGSTVTSYSVSRYGIDGTGAVSSVNGQSPDINGNVALTANNVPTSDNLSIQAHITAAEEDIDTLQSDMTTVQADVTDLKATASASKLQNRKLILIGDSYGLDTSWWTGWQTAFDNLGIYAVYKSSVGGSGFLGDPNVDTFLEQLQGISVPDKDAITDIVVMGGYNDASMAATEADLLTACKAFSAYANANYPNAKVHYGFIGVSYESNGMQATLNNYANIFRKVCSKSNISFISNAQYLLLNRDNIFISSGNANSNFHPSTKGNEIVAEKLAEYLTEGYFDVKYGFQYGGLSIYSKNGEVKIFSESYGFSLILPAMTYPFNTWTLIADLTDTATNLLWGTHDAATCFKFWAAVYAGSFISDALFKIQDKKIYINPLNSASGLVLSSPGWICLQSAVSPFEAMYG